MSAEESIRDVRLQKLARMRELGRDPYAIERWQVDHPAQYILDRFDELQAAGATISLAGRIVSYRLMGKAGFAHISDGDAKIQGYFRKDNLSPEDWELYELLDIGDHIGIVGEPFLTKTGEKSIHVRSLQPLSKALQSLPIGKAREIKDDAGNVLRTEHWYELDDVEQRYRHRHLDLIANKEARDMLVGRMRMLSAVRRFFDSRGYLEAETPVLQAVAGGAAARPFTTRYNAYAMDVKLRISLELYLKRLICGDVNKVYEIGRVFRNEGVSNRHNPEFTLLEWYEAYANLEQIMDMVEQLFRSVSDELGLLVNAPGIDFSKPWRRVDLLTEIERHTKLTADDLSSLESAKKALGHREIVNPQTGKRIVADEEPFLGGLIEKLLEVFVEPTLQEPSFVVGYPIETSPLAKKDPKNPRMTRRFEGYVLGREVCNAFSEINDPIDQRERFESQAKIHAKTPRDSESGEGHPMDEEFLFALESGMPPTGGCGIGMDRMAMILFGADVVREVLLFPMMKPAQD